MKWVLVTFGMAAAAAFLMVAWSTAGSLSSEKSDMAVLQAFGIMALLLGVAVSSIVWLFRMIGPPKGKQGCLVGEKGPKGPHGKG